MKDWEIVYGDGDGFGHGDRLTPSPSPSGERGDGSGKLGAGQAERDDERPPGQGGVRVSWDVTVRGVSGRQRDNGRVLRRYQTPQEEVLWKELRGRRVEGLKFRRQVPVGRFIVDFMCFDAGLIVEVDGSQHANEHVREYDDMRTAYLKEQGFEVLRFTNADVETRIDYVTDRIAQSARTRRSPLSPEGEGSGVRR